MDKAIISLKINRINSLSGINSISSLSLIVNKIGEINSSIEFKRIIVLHENYLISRDKIFEMENHIKDMENLKSEEIIRIYPENLKNYICSLLGDLGEIYLISSFPNNEDQIGLIESLFDLFSPYKINIFNTLDYKDKESDLIFCQSNLKKFINYIS